MSPPRVAVRLLEFPLPVYQRAQEHHEELMREFALIALSRTSESSGTVPARLLEIVEDLTRHYAGATTEPDTRRDEAIEAGLESIDLTYLVPPEAAEHCRVLGKEFAEADDYCRAGGTLLTLATPAEARLLRDWYLDAFIDQIAGAEPVPWSAYVTTAAGRR